MNAAITSPNAATTANIKKKGNREIILYCMGVLLNMELLVFS